MKTGTDRVILAKEDFENFPLDAFPFNSTHDAMGEYHFVPPTGHTGDWYCPITDHSRGGPLWMVTRHEKRRVMEAAMLQVAQPPRVWEWNVLATGEADWRDYTVEVDLRRLNTRSPAGVAVRYLDSRCFYLFCLEGSRARLIRVEHEDIRELAGADFAADTEAWVRIEVECAGSSLSCRADGRELLRVSDERYPAGKVALVANAPAQFADFSVSATKAAAADLGQRKQRATRERKAAAKDYPRPKLWRAINTPGFGAGRSIRFGDLSGNGSLDLLIAQCQRRVRTDCYADISCLTAVDLDGRVLWQNGEPNPANAFLTADMAFQIADIDLDGRNEVILARDFKIQILDGATGRLKRSASTPFSTTPVETLYSGVPFGAYAFDRVNIDCIRICNFSGKEKPTDILVKDRYSRLWAYNSQLELMWTWHDGITGHFPWTSDLDGDGKDEMFVGYSLVDHDGKKLWSLPISSDHTDEIVIGRFHPERDENLIALVCGHEGYVIADLSGKVLVKEKIGHAQRISIGNYRPDLPGLAMAVTTYWGHQGIIRLCDGRGKMLHEFEPGTNGNVVAPVNWRGDGADLILLNGDVELGGLIDGFGRQVVRFPDDGHPELCAEALDLCGDSRDEIVLWDDKRIWIYTQADQGRAAVKPAPEKYPHRNGSNYRGEYAFRPRPGS